MYYLFVHEGGHYIFTGSYSGYKTLGEAKTVAELRVDDALPNNTVLIMQLVAIAGMEGDGGTYIKDIK